MKITKLNSWPNCVLLKYSTSFWFQGNWIAMANSQQEIQQCVRWRGKKSHLQLFVNFVVKFQKWKLILNMIAVCYVCFFTAYNSSTKSISIVGQINSRTWYQCMQRSETWVSQSTSFERRDYHHNGLGKEENFPWQATSAHRSRLSFRWSSWVGLLLYEQWLIHLTSFRRTTTVHCKATFNNNWREHTAKKWHPQ